MYKQSLYKVVEPIKINTIKRLNKSKKWEYGYNKEHDVVVISKTGMIGEIYEVQNLKIALPQQPKQIHKFKSNKWEVTEYPKELNRINTIFDWKEYPREFKSKYIDYIENEFKKREEGFWYYNKSKPTYITGTHYMYLQWSKIDVGKPTFVKQTDYSTFSGKLVKQINDPMGCVILKTDDLVFPLWLQERQLIWQPYQVTLDLVYYPSLGLMRKRCLPTRWYPYRLITPSFSSRYKMVWTDQRRNLPTEFQHQSLQDGTSQVPINPKPYKVLTQPSTGRTQVITPMMERNLNSLSTMNQVNGKGRTTSSTTGGLRKQRYD